MVALPIGWGSVRGIVIGGLVLLAGAVTATVADNGLAALVAAIVLLILLVLDDRYAPEDEE